MEYSLDYTVSIYGTVQSVRIVYCRPKTEKKNETQ